MDYKKKYIKYKLKYLKLKLDGGDVILRKKKKNKRNTNFKK